MEINVLTIIYLLASVTFILGLKMLSNPATARRGNLIAAAGMTIAILATIFLYKDDEGNNRRRALSADFFARRSKVTAAFRKAARLLLSV